MSHVAPKFVDYSRNAFQIYVDAANGSDVAEPGRGGILQPYASLPAALAAAVAAPGAGNYLLVLAAGTYAGAAIAWPVVAGKNISMQGAGGGITTVSHVISYTALGLGDEIIFFTDMTVSNDITVDMALGTISFVILQNGAYGVTRIDTLPPGPQFVKIVNSFVSNFDTSSVMLLDACQFVGGTFVVQATGLVLMLGNIFASMTVQVDGTLGMIGTNAQGTTFNGAGTVNSDATSLLNTIIAGPTVDLIDNAPFINYDPAVLANWLVTPATVQEALDDLAARVSASISFDNVRYVAKNGNDATGDGSINKPYLTVEAASASILDATNLKRYAILVMPGRYTETGLTLKANVFIVGVGQNWFDTRIANNVAIDLNADFSVANDIRSGFANINIASALNLDFNAVGSNEGKVYLNNCQITSTLTMTKFSAINQLTIADCQSFGVITQNGCTVEYQNNDFFNNVVVNSATGVTTNCIFHDCDFEADLTIQGNGVDAIAAQMFACRVAGTLTVDDLLVTLDADVVSLPRDAALVISGGAVLNRTSEAFGLGFTPAVPADWIVPPTEVKGALDELATRVGAGNFVTEYRTLTAPEIAAGQLTLGATPTLATSTTVDIAGGTAQFYGDDFTVAGNILSWTGLGMDGLVIAGDKLVINYGS